MRVLFLTPSVRLLGARQSLLALAKALPAGVEAMVAASGEGGLTDELRAIGVPVEVVPHGPWRKVPGRLRAVFQQVPKLKRIVRRFRPDIVHANEFHSIPQGACLAGETVGSRALCGHVRLGISPRQIRNYRLGDCHRIVAVSRACAGLFDGSGLEDRVRVVHNGVDVSAMAPESAAQAGAALRAEWGWPPGETLVLCLLGLVSERKNQALAVEAVVRANALGAPARLLLAGDAFKSSAGYGEALRARIESPDARDGSGAPLARWLPFQREVAPLYGAADINLLVSSEEGFGRTIIEAGAVGRPSVGSSVGGIPELVEQGRTGWIVPEGDAEALAERIAEAWRDRGALAGMGAAARERAVGSFSLEAHAAAMVAVWREAVALARPGD